MPQHLGVQHFGLRTRRSLGETHAGPQLGRVLLSANYTAPSTQTFPASLSAAATLTGLTWTEVIPFNMSSGNAVGAAGTTLTARGTVRYAKTTPLWDGSSMLNTKAVEFRGASDVDGFQGATSLWNLSTSTTIVFAIACARTAPATRSLFRKRNSGTSAGYDVNMVAGFGIPIAHVGDGTTTVTVNGPGVTGELDGPASGAVVWCALQMDLTSGKVRLYAYRDVGADATMPAGTKTNSEVFNIGGWDATLFDHEGCKLLWLGVLRGADAEAFSLTHLNLLDQVARPPATMPSYVRYSVVSPRVGYEPGFGLRVQHLAGSFTMQSLCHFAHLYHPSATLSTQKLGAYMARATALVTEPDVTTNKRNQALQSDDFANAAWSKSSITAVANAAEDPAGFTAAASLTASAGNGKVSQVFTTIANKPYAWSVYVRRNGGADVALKLRLVDVTAAATISEVSKTATSEWTRIDITATDTDATSIRAELEIVTNGESIYATFAQFEFGWVSEYQQQRASLLDRDDMEAAVVNTSGRYLKAAGGRVQTTVCCYVDDIPAEAYIFSAKQTNDAVTGSDVIVFVTLPNGGNDTEAEQHTSDGAYVLHMTAPDQDRSVEQSYGWAWDARRPISNGHFAIITQGGVEYPASGSLIPAAAWYGTGVADTPTIHPGSQYTNTGHLEGMIEKFETWGPAP